MKLILPALTAFFCSTAFAQQRDSIPQLRDTGFNRTQRLGEVVVKTKRPVIEMQADKMVLNVQNDITAAGSTLFEVLQKAPGVSVTNDETIKLAGKLGVNILVDGRPVQMSEKDLANYLKSTPVSLVDKIEVIMNPSSKYDAQGNAGIINIRLKKNTAKGANGNVSGSYTQNKHGNAGFSGNINVRQGKWNWFGNASVRKSKQNTDGEINRFVQVNGVEKVFENKTVDQDPSSNISFQTGADYFLDKKSIFGFIVKGSEYRSRLYTPGVTLIKTNSITDSSLHTLNDNHERNSRYNFNLNYKYEDNAGNELNIDADYTSYKNKNTGLVTTGLVNKQNMQYGYTANDQHVLTGIKIYSIKTDYNKELKKAGAKIETGLKFNTVQTDNDLQAAIWNVNRFKADTDRTNRFSYTETIYAAYASFGRKVKKWEYQIGLRAEQSVIKGKSTDLRNIILPYPDTSYLNFFPTAFIRCTIDDKNSIGLSYGRRINRPTFQDLNPFEYIFDNYSKEKGNPYLLPEYSNNIELNYSYSGSVSVGLGYSLTNNSFQDVSTLKGQVIEESNYNIGSEKRVYINLNVNKHFTKYWDGYFNLSPFYKVYNGAIATGSLDNSTWGMSWYTNHSFNLPNKWKVQISSWGNIPTLDGIYRTSALGSIDAGISKQLMKDRMSVRMQVTDIFNTQRWKQQVDFEHVHYNYYRKWESRGICLQVNWKFGKTNYRQRERELGAQDEINRIK